MCKKYIQNHIRVVIFRVDLNLLNNFCVLSYVLVSVSSGTFRSRYGSESIR